MKPRNVAIAVAAGVALLLFLSFLVGREVSSAKARLLDPEKAAPAVAKAQQAEEAYCTPAFKEVLARVIHSCGLGGEGGRRGCQPADVRSFANISDADFNALFTPLQGRGGVVLFDVGKEELDEGARQLLRDRWMDRKGARYFFVVARASKTGTAAKNRALSHRRANSILFALRELATDDPQIDDKVGLLWLGNEFAQLSAQYCDWPNSRQGGKCDEEAINRSAFVSWVDCRL